MAKPSARVPDEIVKTDGSLSQNAVLYNIPAVLSRMMKILQENGSGSEKSPYICKVKLSESFTNDVEF